MLSSQAIDHGSHDNYTIVHVVYESTTHVMKVFVKELILLCTYKSILDLGLRVYVHAAHYKHMYIKCSMLLFAMHDWHCTIEY